MSENNRKKILWVLCMTIIFMLFITIVLPKVSNYSSEKIGVSHAPDTSFYYTSDELYDTANLYGEEGRKTYILLRWTFDVIWPFVYTGFLMSWIYLLSYKSKFKRLYLLPLIAMGFDFLENIGATLVFYYYPDPIDFLAFLTPYFSLLKWTTLSLTFALWLVLIVIKSFKSIKKRINK